jgi:hypothetical protein
VPHSIGEGERIVADAVVRCTVAGSEHRRKLCAFVEVDRTAMPWHLRQAPAPSPPPQYLQEGTHPYHRADDLIVFRQGSRIVPAKELGEGARS